MTNVMSNGSKWDGEEPDTIDQLCQVLAAQPLDRTFEELGNFVIEPTVKYDGVVRFFGNFLTVSHVFSIYSDEPEVIGRLTALIRANQQRPDYRSQPDPAKARAEENKARDKAYRARWNAKGRR